MDGSKLEFGKSIESENDSLQLIKQAIAPGITNQEVLDIYGKWAKTYDKDLSKMRFNPPKLGAEHLASILGEKTTARILDCGAGTGLCGLELHRLGYKNLDALDASSEMLDQAKSKQIYKNFICDFMGPNRLGINDDTYDALVSTAAFAQGHVKSDCFEELIRITKPGGVILIVIRKDYLETVPDFRKNMMPTLNHLVESKKWSWLVNMEVPEFHNKQPGVVFAFTVL